ncbi:phage tail tape measure protein [Enterococcus avium]|uniref:phage tail tape measure protein n=1 Tax=Enterococcus avium TaxID=33945 RepID=UPI001F588082|nr:phage tail tape measure protein [Enterococcus avium]
MVQNGKPLGNMIIKLGLDSSAFSDSLTGAQRAVKTAVREMRAGFKVAGGGATTLSALTAKQQGLTKVIKAQEKELGYLKKAYDNTLDSQGNATSKTAAAAQKYNAAQAKLAMYKQEMIDTAGAMADMKVRTEGVTGTINRASEKFSSAGEKMQTAGSAMTKGVTLPLIAGAAAVTKAAVSWESDFAGVKKTNDEVVDSTGKVVYSYKDLEQGLRNLATELPASHKEIAGVAEAAGQLGIKTQNVKSFTKTMIDLGESTNMSSETAATSLARFTNIVGMSQKDFDKLGSVVVDLGNNFATTESEIVAMGLRLAGAGEQIGMTEGEIMGFATALSSVGIEAEAGGSAFSKVMIQMQLAVEKGSGAFEDLRERAADAGISMEQLQTAIRNGGKDQKAVAEAMGMTSSELKKMYTEADKSKTSLESFSNVAGMTSEQFSKLFKDDPSKAITAFIQGLKDSEKHGTSAIKVLEDMGIKEVRLRDSLLRAANASDIFDDAIQRGNKAWKENSALTEEANKRYETTESKLKMLKNEAVNAAIDLGGPFVDALRDSIEAGKPLIKTVGELAESFSNADPKTQRAIIKLIAFSVAAGPVLSVAGKLSSGIGAIGSSFVDLSAKIAKKKAIAEITKELATGTLNVDKLSTALSGGATKMGLFGSAAGKAAGSSGLGAVATTLGPLTPAILGLVGAGGALALGYGAWKIFGEEAWNSAQRVKQWGTDVGAETDKVLDKVQSNTQSAAGQFTLMKQGFDVDTSAMVKNFETIGQTIEGRLTKKIKGLDKLLKDLPASVDSAVKDLVEQEKQEAEKALQLAHENTERISQIKKKAHDNDRALSISEAKIIQDLAKETTTSYVETLDLSSKEKKKVLAAMTGDVAQASKEEAKLWLQSLGEQRRAAEDNAKERKRAREKELKDMNYSLESEFAQKYLAAWDEIDKTTIEGFDSQMALIAEKYPELADEVSFSSGKLISSMGEAGIAAMDMNQEIIKSAGVMTNEIAKKAEENADKISWTADETNKATEKAATFWNGLVFDEKTGEVKTNVREVIKEAASDTDKWNNLRLMIHDANLDSNAKLMIGEAAIANNQWDNLSWKEKNIILKDEFSKQMFNALEESGKWNELNLEQKTALLYSNTPEVMAENMLKLGLWDDMQPQVKKLKAENYDFLSTLSQSEEKLANWSSIPEETKKILGDNYDFLQKIYSSELSYSRWVQMPDDQKRLLGDNTDILQKILTSEISWNNWNLLPDDQKKMLGNNDQLLATVFSSRLNYDSWVRLPDNLKRMLGDNTDVVAKLHSGELKLQDYNNINPDLKRLLGDSFNVEQAARNAGNTLNTYKANNPAEKALRGNSSSVQNAANQGGNAIVRYRATNAPDKHLRALDQASGPASSAKRAVNNFSSGPSLITKTLRVVADISGKVKKLIGLEKGTNYHLGGSAIVNDQKGSVYKELVIPKGGIPFIPEGRNVFLPNLPRGSKVINATKTKKLIPHYANGVGISQNSSLYRNLTEVNSRTQTTNISIESSTKELESLLKEMLNVISRLKPEINIYPQNWQAKTDIKRTSEELAVLTAIEKRGRF